MAYEKTMGGPRYEDMQLIWDGDLTDFCYDLNQMEPVGKMCPICGSEHITLTDEDLEDFDTYIRGYICNHCGSEFSFTYWTSAIYVRRDGRFNKEEG